MKARLNRTVGRIAALLCLATALVCAAPAQLAGLKSLTAAKASVASTAPVDQLGRTSPRGTLLGFMQAAQKGDTERALEYLQIPRQEREVDSEKIVQSLMLLLDRAWVGRVAQVSDSPEPSYSPQLPAGYERAGTFSVQGKDLDLLLVRETDETNGNVWLISWATLSKVSDLAVDVRSHDFERYMPRVLVQYLLFDLPLWVWAVFLAIIPVALLVGYIVVLLIRGPIWVLRKMRHRAADWETWNIIRPPVVLFATAFAHAVGIALARTPLLFRVYYGRVLQTVLLFAVAWLLWDLVSAWTRRTRASMTAPADRGTLSLILLGHRLLKACIGIAAVLTALGNMGVNLTTALAGLGLGGIAVALAAQKTIENLFGGVSVLTDRVIRVGDYCRIGDKVGTVEDIGLRSTRIRTLDRSQVSIPNGVLATVNVENLSMREKILLCHKLGLRYETSAGQLQVVLANLRAMFYSHPLIETDTARVRFVGFADSALSIELFAYVLTRDYNEFVAVQEDILLRTMQIVEESGTDFAFPSQTLYFARDSGLDQEKSKEAVAQLEEWKASQQLPFPDFAPEEIAAMSDSIEYPTKEAAVRQSRASSAGSTK